jgi:hypothetical protein
MRDGEIIAFLAVGLIFGMPIVWLFLHYGAKTIKACYEIRLERDMVARGFSAQEIVQVVSGKVSRADAYEAHGIPPAKPIRAPSYH